MAWVTRLWKRRITGQPDGYQAYVSLPTEPDRPTTGEVHDLIERLERAFEGRLDVYARVDRLAVVTDRVPSEQVDVTAFEACLDSLEALYAETYSLARLEKWRSVDGALVRAYVAVPVKPLFPDRDGDRPVRSADY